MRYLLIFVMLVFSGSAQAKSMVKFGGQDFKLAFVGKNDDVFLNEYIPVGQNLKGWKNMLAVHRFNTDPKVTPSQFALALARRIRSTNPKAKISMTATKAKDIVMLDFLTWPRSVKFFEFNVFKFWRDKKTGKMIGFQYAYRHYGKPTKGLAQFLQKSRLRWIAEMRDTQPPKMAEKK